MEDAHHQPCAVFAERLHGPLPEVRCARLVRRDRHQPWSEGRGRLGPLGYRALVGYALVQRHPVRLRAVGVASETSHSLLLSIGCNTGHGSTRTVEVMSMTFSTTPTPGQLRTLPTTDLAMLLLASLDDQPNPNNVLRGHEQAHSQNREPDADFLMQRVSDAWAGL